MKGFEQHGDITHVEDFLKTTLHLTDTQIIKLTATNTGAPEPSEPCVQWPTYEHMVDAFRRLIAAAQPGDQVYTHYSGHGGRTLTVFSDLKGEHGLDESLVPTDIGTASGQYLRDIELAHLLQTMVDKGLVVTIVLDSCHSGGATRGMGGASVRGVNTIDTTERPMQSLVASPELLSQTWRCLSQATTRQVTLGSGWLPEAQSYLLLAACCSSELAYEYALTDTEKNGALTYWLLDSLKLLGPGYTYKRFHDRIIAKIHSRFEQQTPQLQGEGSRVIFGSGQVPSPYAVTVMRVDGANERIRLNNGQTQAIRKSAQFALYPPSETDFANVGNRLAVVEITDVGATDSWATIVASFPARTIEQGAQAVLLGPGSMRLRRTVRLVYQADLPPTLPQDEPLQAVQEALAHASFINIVTGEAPADFQVVVNAQGAYEIWDPAGHPLANLRPALSISDPAAARLALRLVHLTKYPNIQQLDNADALSPLARHLVVELIGVQAEYDSVDRPEPHPFDDPGSTPSLKPDEWRFLRIKNTSAQVLNITVLDLEPDWSITQMFPAERVGFFEPFDPGNEVVLPLQASLPDGYTDATDVLKVFATVGSTSFRWLEPPPLDQPPTMRVTRGKPANPFEELLATLTVEKPQARQVSPALYATRVSKSPGRDACSMPCIRKPWKNAWNVKGRTVSSLD